MAPMNPRRLPRAAWALGAAVDGSSLPPLKEAQRSLDLEGVRLVQEVAKSWTNRFQFTIMQLGFDDKASFHYECIFSCPTNNLPVASVVLSTRFALVLPSEGKDPRLLYSFEEGDLRHEWKLAQDEEGQWVASAGQQFSSLGDGSFEKYLDRIVDEKDKVRSCGVDLTTSFGATRLRRPPAHSDDGSEAGSEEIESSRGHDSRREVFDASAATNISSDINANMNPTPTAGQHELDQQDVALAMREALQAAGLYCDKVEPPSSLAALLANIFDAADEENAGELPHYEVARLLCGVLPGFGLELWDIYLLMTSAQENDDGFIECKPFIQSAPEIVQALRRRRQLYRSRGLPGVEIPLEAVKHCFAEEVNVTSNQLMKVLEQLTVDDPSCGRWSDAQPRQSRQSTKEKHGGRASQSSPSSPTAGITRRTSSIGMLDLGDGSAEGSGERFLIGIKRRFCQDCLATLPERLSPQECMRLLQMLPEDEDGFIRVDELAEHLEHLRTEAMLNALVESDVLSLRTHLVLRFRHLGLEQDGRMRLWIIKQALLQADQVCLTRLQIHVLLCLAETDVFGNVNIANFLGTCCSIIPHMFDARLFKEAAERLILEHAEAMRRSENEELAALGAAQNRAKTEQDGEKVEEKVEVDSDTVEKILQQVLTLNDDLHRNPPMLPPETIFSILQNNEREVQSTQLSTYELTGLLAEMQPDEAEGLVTYVDHIKKWVPIIFEQRKNRLLGRYLEENAAETLGVDTPDLDRLEAMFPLLPITATQTKPRGSQRRSSRLRESKDSFMDSRHNSIRSNPPSYRRPGASGDTPVNSKDMRLRGAHAKSDSQRRRSLSNQENKEPKAAKEPPPGRGYQRRKALLALAAADAAAKGTAGLSP